MEGRKLLSRRIYFSIPLIIYARNRIHTHMGIYWIFILYSNARRRTANVSASASGRDNSKDTGGTRSGEESAASPGRRTVKWGNRRVRDWTCRGWDVCGVYTRVSAGVLQCVCLGLRPDKATDAEKWREFTWVICATSCTIHTFEDDGKMLLHLFHFLRARSSS